MFHCLTNFSYRKPLSKSFCDNAVTLCVYCVFVLRQFYILIKKKIQGTEQEKHIIAKNSFIVAYESRKYLEIE